MVDEEDLAVRAADAMQLGEEPVGPLDHRHDVHRHHLVEARVGEAHALGVHLEERLDVREALARDAAARLLEHLARDIDAGDGHVARVKRKRQSRAHADLEHALAGAQA